MARRPGTAAPPLVRAHDSGIAPASDVADAPLLQTRLGCTTTAVLLCLGIGLRLANLENVTRRTPDEIVYTRQANLVLQQGTEGVRSLVAQYQRDPSVRLYPPPTRAGYLWALAATMRLGGRTDEGAGAILSCAASVGSLFMLTLVGIRFFPPWATLFALLFFSVSPAELELARRTWADALSGFLGLSLVWVAGEITRAPGRRLWHWAFAIVGGLATLIKESGPIVFGLCTVWVVWVLLMERRTPRDAVRLMGGISAAAAATVLWLASSVGGVSTLIQTWTMWLQANAANPYALEYQSGPGYLLLEAFHILSPLTAVLCAVGLAVALSYRRSVRGPQPPTGTVKREVIFWMALFALAFLAIPMLLPHWLNLRYLSALFGPFYLLAGLGFCCCVSVLWPRLSRKPRAAFAAVVIAALLVVASTDHRRFRRMFVRDALGDLSVKLVVDFARLADAQAHVERDPSPENYLDLCEQYHQNWRDRDSIAACQEAVRLRPRYVEAYEAMATTYDRLEMWDEAIGAARTALQLDPASASARRKLEWSLDRKQRKDAERAPQR